MQWSEVIEQPEGPARTLALTAWLQGLYPGDDVPILVGGSAVELFTRGAYVSADYDLVGFVPESVARKLKDVGFTRKGRYWIQEKEQIFLEFPSATLRVGEEFRAFGESGREIRIISPEDLIVDRLLSLVYWGAKEDGVNAALIFSQNRRSLDLRRLRKRAKDESVEEALSKLQRLFHRRPDPTREDMSSFLEGASGGSSHE